jgi:hypothetical protein
MKKRAGWRLGHSLWVISSVFVLSPFFCAADEVTAAFLEDKAIQWCEGFRSFRGEYVRRVELVASSEPTLPPGRIRYTWSEGNRWMQIADEPEPGQVSTDVLYRGKGSYRLDRPVPNTEREVRGEVFINLSGWRLAMFNMMLPDEFILAPHRSTPPISLSEVLRSGENYAIQRDGTWILSCWEGENPPDRRRGCDVDIAFDADFRVRQIFLRRRFNMASPMEMRTKMAEVLKEYDPFDVHITHAEYVYDQFSEINGFMFPHQVLCLTYNLADTQFVALTRTTWDKGLNEHARNCLAVFAQQPPLSCIQYFDLISAEVNVPVSDEEFQLRVEPGTIVSDARDNSFKQLSYWDYLLWQPWFWFTMLGAMAAMLLAVGYASWRYWMR